MFSLLGLIPAALNAVASAFAKAKDVTITTVQTTGQVAGQQLQYMTAALGHPFSPVALICYGVAIWFFKASAIDKVICPPLGLVCSTDPLTGDVKEIAMIAISGMFALYGIKQFRG